MTGYPRAELRARRRAAAATLRRAGQSPVWGRRPDVINVAPQDSLFAQAPHAPPPATEPGPPPRPAARCTRHAVGQPAPELFTKNTPRTQPKNRQLRSGGKVVNA